ncbi:MAG TPA: STAS domain-containing protein [Solirubrobacteraceae bacterium]|jgi:anti-sigma B factor antagonist|nr:STAS domain-containing protein [Solirubrobacteraceae bacterium]
MCPVDGASRANGSESNSSERLTRLSVREHDRAGERTLVLSGELDLASRPLFDQAMRCVERRDTAALVLDLSEVAFMDSTGLHGVLAAKTLCAEHSCTFVLVRGSSQVQRLFELSGVIDELQFRGAADAGPHGRPKPPIG